MRADRNDPRRNLGKKAEDLCAAELERQGWRVLDRNWRVRMGELDIIALQGDTVVVVEVKSLRGLNRMGPETPALAVGAAKQRRIRRLAAAWLMSRRRSSRPVQLRFDVIALTFDPDGSVSTYEHLENAF
jgi:putative endonuclease